MFGTHLQKGSSNIPSSQISLPPYTPSFSSFTRPRSGANVYGSTSTANNNDDDDDDDLDLPRVVHQLIKKHTRRVPKWVIWSIVLGLTAMWYTTPVQDWIVQWILRAVPISADIKLGKAVSEHCPHPVIDHPVYTPQLHRVCRDLMQTATSGNVRYYATATTTNKHNQQRDGIFDAKVVRQYRWDFNVIRCNEINAFALPGGQVQVTDSLLKQLHLTDGELAALCGHEMGHVLARHGQASMLDDSILHYLAEIVLNERQHHRHWGEKVGELLLQSSSFLGTQKYSRKQEYEADAVAWALLSSTPGYTPKSLTSLLKKLQRLEEQPIVSSASSASLSSEMLIPDEWLAWSSTHPATADRIEASQLKWTKLSRLERWRLSRNPL
jgi:Zn-dependent protease with chaperone function